MDGRPVLRVGAELRRQFEQILGVLSRTLPCGLYIVLEVMIAEPCGVFTLSVSLQGDVRQKLESLAFRKCGDRLVLAKSVGSPSTGH